MRKLLTFLIALAAVVGVTASSFGGSMGLLGVGKPAAGGGCALDTSTCVWVAAVQAAGGTVSAGQQTNVNTLITGLKSAGLFTTLDRLWLFASENTFQAAIDIIGLHVLGTITGPPTFTASQGYTGDAFGSAFIDSGFIPSTSGVNYTLNNASIGVYNRTNRTFSQGASTISALDGSSNASALQIFSFSFNIAQINDNNPMLATPPANAQGFWIASRSSNARALYQNGNTTPVGSDTQTPSALPSVSIGLLGRNNNGSLDQRSNDELAIVLMGRTLTSGNVATLSTLINGGYMTT
jgi:hypothetical protein